MTIAERLKKGIDKETNVSVKLDIITSWMEIIKLELEDLDARTTEYEDAVEMLIEMKKELEALV